MKNTNKVNRRWQPLEWFLEGWHSTYREGAAAGDPEGFKALEEMFGPRAVQPGWIVELEQIFETNFPAVIRQVTESLIPEIRRSLLVGSDLVGCGSFLRGCAAYGIVTDNYFHGRTALPGYRDFIERLRTQLYEAGATLAEQKLTDTTAPRQTEGQLIVISPNGIEHRQKLGRRQDSHPLIAALEFPSPNSIILKFGSSHSAYIRAHDGTILSYQIGLENFFALGCSGTGRFNPFGLSVEELWSSQRHFPLIGSLTDPTDEIENGLSWWRITNPQVAPLQVGLPGSTY